MHFMERISDGLNRLVYMVVCSMGIAMTLIVAIQVFFRYVLNNSLFWSEEVALLILVWLTFLGATVAYHRGAHPGMDEFIRHMPRIVQKAGAILVHLASLSLFISMITGGTQFAWFVRAQITPALHLHKWITMSVVPISGVIFTIHALAFILKELSKRHDA